MEWSFVLIVMRRSLPARIQAPLLLAQALGGAGLPSLVQGGPIQGGVGGPAAGAGLLPGPGLGAAGPGMTRPAGVTPAAGGVGGPAFGAGLLPGAGLGRPGLGR